MLSVSLLGGLRLHVDGTDFVFAARPKVGPLLAYLLIHCRARVPRDSVAFALWPDDVETVARSNLRRHLQYLRDAMPPSVIPWLTVDDRTLCVNPKAPIEVDAWKFERALEKGDLHEAARTYGEFLPGCYDEWAVVVRERFHRAYVAALWDLALQARGRRDPLKAKEFLQHILADDPWREDAVRALMAAQYEAGDRSSALQLCANFEGRLSEEMGVALMPETFALRRAIECDEPLPTVRPTSVREVLGSPGDLPFAGRDGELSRLHEAWQRAIGGGGALSLVVGEAGIGKSRLASEFALQIESRGGRVLWGTTSSPERTPYQPLAEILRAAFTLLDKPSLSGSERRLIAQLVPELRIAGRDSLEEGAERQKLFDAVSRALIGLASARPLLVVLEDVHAGGSATLAMLRDAAFACRASPILFVATARSMEAAEPEAFAALRRPFHGTRPLVITLSPIAESAALAIAATTAGVTDVTARQIVSVAGGHPLFLTEMLHAFATSEGPVNGQRLPKQLQTLLANRIKRFSSAGQLLLKAAAVAGYAFDLEIISEVIGWNDAQVSDALDELIAGFAVRESTHAVGFACEFAHDLLATAAYQLAEENERRRWHRRTARAAERWYASRLDELSAFIGRHYELGGEPLAGAKYYLQAARAAAALFANEEALALGDRALGLSPARDSLRYDLLALREEVCERIGDRAAQAMTLDELEEVARELGSLDRRLEVLRRRESLQRYLGEFGGARTTIAELKRLGSDNARWEAIALRDEAVLEFESGSRQKASSIVATAATRAAAADDAWVFVSTLTLQARIAAALGRRDETSQSLARAKEVAAREGSASLRLRVAYCEICALLVFQACAPILAAGRTVLALAKRVGSRETLAGTHAIVGGAHAMQFNVAPARHHLSKAIELYRGSDVTGELLALNNLATLELEVGRLDRVESALKAMEKVFEEPGIDPDECCYKLLRCELSLRREDYEETLRLADDLAAYASERGNRLLEGEGLRCKGLALRALARRTESVVAFEQAVDALSRSGAAESLVRAKLELVFADAIAGNDRTGGNAEDASLGMEDEEALTPSDLWSLAQALHSMGQYGRARGILQRAHAGFLSRLGRLASAADRSAYAAHPSHAELLRASASRTPWAAQRSQ